MGFCAPKMEIIFLAFIVVYVATVGAYVEVKTPRDTPYDVKNTIFYLLTGNYTVGTKEKFGTFQVQEMNLNRDAWVIFYTKPQTNTVRSGDSPCEDDLRQIPQDRIMKIYNNHTIKVSSDTPDQWNIQKNTIVCFQLLQKASREEWGSFKYKYEDSCSKKVVTESRPLKYYGYKTFTIRSHKRCYATIANFSTVVDFQMTLKNATSLDRVLVTGQRTTIVNQCSFKSRYEYNYGYRYVKECKDVTKTELDVRYIMITGQTPDKFLQQQWPLVLTNSSHVCFDFEAVEEVAFKDDVVFRISEFPACKGDVYNRTGALVSPGYPLTPYRNNTNCTWTIKVRPGERISVKFGDTKSNCTNDYIMLSGVNGGSNNTELLCGDSVTGRSFISTSNQLVVKFRTSTFSNLKGFLMNYSVIGCSLQLLSIPVNSVMLNEPKDKIIRTGFKLKVGCKHGTVFPSKVGEVDLRCLPDNTWFGHIPDCVGYTVCNETLTAPEGYVTSPGYPRAYPRNTRCRWTIKAKPGQRIRIRFEDIKSICTNDYITLGGVERKAVNTTKAAATTPTTTTPVTVAAGQKKTRSKRATSSQTDFMLCGSHVYAGEEFTSAAHTVDIKFMSDIFEENGYFNMSYTALGCSSEDLRKPSNVLLRNPAKHYPTDYKLELGCPTGLSFPGGTNITRVVCGKKGSWVGKIPRCVYWRTGL
ncbi:CUB and sushi domain-containing protein 3-like [Lineus longissimus]|uniref:CUB and sushi domain-containing protein 3-like n=1 Tax=Lineus longissimus TaxID=88925 RepID=UPI00315D3FA2